MKLHRWIYAMCLGLPLAAAAAEPPAAEAAASSASSAMSDAMERAQRRAANPMRAILEASRIRRKGSEPDAVAPPVRMQAVVAPSAVDVVPTAAAVSTPAPAPSPQPAPSPPAEAVLSATGLGAGPANSVPSMSAPTPVQTLSTLTLDVVAPLELVAPASTEPKLLHMVEPEVPQSVLASFGSMRRVEIDLSLRADGTVADATMVPPVPMQLRRYLMQALMQWRFEPLAAARTHRVQLVFNPG